MADRMYFRDLLYTQNSVANRFRDGFHIRENSWHVNESVKVTYFPGNQYRVAGFYIL